MVHERGLKRKPLSTAFAGNLHEGHGSAILDCLVTQKNLIQEEKWVRGATMSAAHTGCGDKIGIDYARVIHDVKKNEAYKN